MRAARVLATCIALAVVSSACEQVRAAEEVLCRPVPPTVLLAQAVPTASQIPCVREVPAGWSVGGFAASEQGGSFAVEVDGNRWVNVELQASCEPGEALRHKDDEDGTERWIDERRTDPYRATWLYRFEGGCATYEIDLPPGTVAGEVLPEITAALSFIPRGDLASELEPSVGSVG